MYVNWHILVDEINRYGLCEGGVLENKISTFLRRIDGLSVTLGLEETLWLPGQEKKLGIYFGISFIRNFNLLQFRIQIFTWRYYAQNVKYIFFQQKTNLEPQFLTL